MIKIKKFVSKNLLADLLLVGSFFIIFFTTYELNRYIALYLLGVIMAGGSYLMLKGGK